MMNKPKRKIQPARLMLWPVVAAAGIALVAGAALGIFGVSLSESTVEGDPPTPIVNTGAAQAALDTSCETWVQRPRTEARQYVQNELNIAVMEEDVVYAADETESLPYSGTGASYDAADMPGDAPSVMPTPIPTSTGHIAPPEAESMRSEAGIGTTGGTDPSVATPEGETSPDMDRAESEPLAPPLPGASGDDAFVSVPVQQQDPLRAGEVDDNADWDDYQDYRRDYLLNNWRRSVLDVDVDGRQIIQVVDAEGNNVLGACVEVYHGESLVHRSRTYATGLTLFFPNVQDATRYVQEFTVVARKGDLRAEATLNRESVTGATRIELPFTQQIPAQLDVMFLLDATGSMSDELRQLQDNILSISAELDALGQAVDVRYGVLAYRDRGDAYTTRLYGFTADVAEFQTNLNEIRAGGGGDTPESMNQGLDEALNEVAWRGENTIKLMFLVADAEPHLDYQDDVAYAQSMAAALERGIKIHAIAGSGVSDPAEYVMRQIAQYTMGKFIFLTYEDGVAGTPGDERPDLDVGAPRDEQGVGDYSVSQLDELVLRLITDEIAELAS